MGDQIPQRCLLELRHLLQQRIGTSIESLELVAVEQQLRLLLMTLGGQLQGLLTDLLMAPNQ